MSIWTRGKALRCQHDSLFECRVCCMSKPQNLLRSSTVVEMYRESFQLLWLFSALALCSAFAPLGRHRCRRSLHMAFVAVEIPPVLVANAPIAMDLQSESRLTSGIRSYTSSLPDYSVDNAPTVLLSLQERKIPTQEEIDQKKLTFNLIFWGGGFVAPFAATVFYFGFKFWEK
jgi:hypothetical protein